MTDNQVNIWTSEVEEIAEQLRVNCVNLSDYHRRRYYHYKGYGKYFRIPLIILASLNSTASVGLQPYMEQNIISGITCIMGMLMGIMGSIELYMGIQSSMDLELKHSKDFYTLAVEIYKVLRLRRDNRGESGKDFLNNKYSKYIKLCEASNLLRRKLKTDLLTSIPPEYEDLGTPTASSQEIEAMEMRPLYREPRPSITLQNLTLPITPERDETIGLIVEENEIDNNV